MPATRLPAALADLHHALAPDDRLALRLPAGDGDGPYPGDGCASRWRPGPVRDVVVGAGFTVDAIAERGGTIRVEVRRARTLADTVGPGMRLLVCGLNPSERAADTGIGFAGPGNRFWPAAVAAGIVARDRDPGDALVAHGVGMTDLVKRTTASASAITSAEYRAGADRVERLVRWLAPATVCFVGLAGYRAARRRGARPGWQPEAFGGAPAYLMPSTSGRNAHETPGSLAAHLRRAAAGPPGG